MTKRIAVVTGANKGIGFEICKQLASNGVKVILTARDVKRGSEAIEKLKAAGYSDVIFHQLDVVDKASISSFANFIRIQFGKLDILINNAGITSIIGSLETDYEQTYETASDCIRTNYYGMKQVSKELIPLLELSNSARIINVSSSLGWLKNISNENARKELGDVDGLTEEKVDNVVEGFLEDIKENLIQVKVWPSNYPAYIVSKAALNAYTRVLAKKYLNISINAVTPGLVKTDLNRKTGGVSVEEGAQGPVMLALMPEGGPSVYYEIRICHIILFSLLLHLFQTFCFRIAVVTGANKGIGFEICKQLASNGVKVILTARDVKRGSEAIEKLKAAGYSDVIFHQLDVVDKASISSFANFIRTQFGKLDILINNAGITSIIGSLETDYEQTYETASDCIRTNYYGMKQVSKELIPLLQLSNSARIINVSSSLGWLKNISNENARKELGDVDGLTEEKVDNVVEGFLEDIKENLIQVKVWPSNYPAYIVSKAALNAYTRVLAKKYLNISINAVTPGLVKTDLNRKTGGVSVEEGAQGPVMLALMPEGGPSGLFFYKTELSTF
ncbi:peroxisomal hydratase-dehydrogenase-epimerase-like [Corylus avellana]|uniref:peroxisomal hydratase-dehydrogenase-epimerase-like n=1 Tax=Corylus avellana TaxID=13451 RepID=UPI00286AC017|nr:peroxisomal hydratase-dehydrogenase-epimerase-like [Corylus avellana]